MSFEQDITMLKYYQEEFVYRHKHFWGLIIKSLGLGFIFALLPFAESISGITLDSDASAKSVVFPIAGIFAAVLSLWLLKQESARISAIQTVKYKIADRLQPEYRYITFERKRSISPRIADVIFGFELSINLLSILMIYSL